MDLINKNNEEAVCLLRKNGELIKNISSRLSLNIKTVRSILSKKPEFLSEKRRKEIENMLGRQFGRLTVISPEINWSTGKRVWNCRCECGSMTLATGQDLKMGNKQSCGCLKIHNGKKNKEKLKTFAGILRAGCGELMGEYICCVKISAKRRGLEYNLTPEFLWELFLKQKSKCKLSGLDIKLGVKRYQTASLDRIDSSIGYLSTNVQWVHKDINTMKMDFPMERFLDLASRITKNIKGGVLSGTRVYLAGNLENSSDSYNWREKVKTELSRMGIVILDPTQVVFEGQPHETEEKRKELLKLREEEKYEEIREYMIPVVQKDLRQIDLSDFVIFNFQVEKPTFGTTHELVLATQQKKPIFVCVGNKKKTPLWFLGIINPNYIYNSIEEVIEIIGKINNGEKEIDSDRWRILKSNLI